jgi:acetyl-CoA carboxylase biotin carboxylase subunit
MRKVLVANRGEIAVRVMRACRDLGLDSVAVFADCDRAARHVRMAGEAVAIGEGPPVENYLRIDRMLEAARASGADAVHPGYGFLSENEGFSAACHSAGLTFIGPTPAAMAQLSNKTLARRLATSVGVPVVPGTEEPFGPDVADEVLAREAARIGYPVLVKAVSGGGGRGMRTVLEAVDLPGAIRAARSEAATAFGDAAVYLERRLVRARHVEVQLLADHHGRIQPFVERECSIQRRHQKVVEESPSPAVSSALRIRLMDAARAVAAAAGYTNAGTVEFLLDTDGRFYFLEMNTRIQVEHPVTEMVTGVDLVAWQIRIARGEPLAVTPAVAETPRGHAIECRVSAEDPDSGFLPSPGRVTVYRAPHGPGIRHDGWVETGTDVPTYYDPLLSKLIAVGDDRRHATARLVRALDEFDVQGIATSLPFLRWLLRQPEFIEARFHTEFLDELLQRRAGTSFTAVDLSHAEVAAIAACLAAAAGVAPGLERNAGTRERQPPGASTRGWTARARREGLRG